MSGIPIARVSLRSASAPRKRWRLIWRGNGIELPQQGAVLIGRSLKCDVVLPSTQVSRVHCRLNISDSGVTVEDLGSSNAVYVNGERARAVRALSSGDQIMVASEELTIYAVGTDAVMDTTIASPHGVSGQPPQTPDAHHAWRALSVEGCESSTTRRIDAFATLGRLADRMLAAGRRDAAAKILSSHMRTVLGAVRSGQPPPEEIIQASIEYAAKVGMACSDGFWIDYIVEIHLALVRPLSREIFHQIRDMMDNSVTVNRELLIQYQRTLRSALLKGSLHDQAIVEAILSL